MYLRTSRAGLDRIPFHAGSIATQETCPRGVSQKGLSPPVKCESLVSVCPLALCMNEKDQGVWRTQAIWVSAGTQKESTPKKINKGGLSAEEWRHQRLSGTHHPHYNPPKQQMTTPATDQSSMDNLVEDPQTPPSMLRMARKNLAPGSFISEDAHELSRPFVNIKMKVVIKCLITRYFLDSKTKTYTHYLKDKGQITPCVEWLLMGQLWHLAKLPEFKRTFPKGFQVANRRRSFQVLHLVEECAVMMRLRLRDLLLFNVSVTHNGVVPDLTHLILKCLIAVEMVCRNPQANALPPIWQRVDAKITYITQTIPETQQKRYHKTLRDLNRLVFDGVKTFPQILKQDFAAIAAALNERPV
ncbi:uncharacterized protein MELLADRAFT_109638 [Melampsora larici-populina 98AG31]|uniref:Uncharacterized protein n=1 Tax=Melampsora larici-populina (strain 98AG31 / pathotype 3-4-7) TaxID=747676 RepID=F4RX45_MELLP|nr:uncharacterized protein MELLADRAFT_109638 [Melampsora larici-populina 98AG31]EGG02900.1 hypothetical protein MELLADRAFT_109638 [Melampsora larici-populina 98AG31]